MSPASWRGSLLRGRRIPVVYRRRNLINQRIDDYEWMLLLSTQIYHIQCIVEEREEGKEVDIVREVVFFWGYAVRGLLLITYSLMSWGNAERYTLKVKQVCV